MFICRTMSGGHSSNRISEACTSLRKVTQLRTPQELIAVTSLKLKQMAPLTLGMASKLASSSITPRSETTRVPFLSFWSNLNFSLGSIAPPIEKIEREQIRVKGVLVGEPAADRRLPAEVSDDFQMRAGLK